MSIDVPVNRPECAVVTGATQGIGKAIAEKLLNEGFDLALCARTESDLKSLVENWKVQFPDRLILTYPADLSEKSAALGFAKAITETFSTVNLLINNAGIFIPGDLATEPDGHLESIMNVNLYSAYHLTRALLPQMQMGSHIVNMCSVASLKAYPQGGSYSISKYALLGFSDNLREELRPRRIRVTSICPGATWSRSWSGSGLPESRLMAASDVADMVWTSHQLSPQASVETIVMRPVDGDL